MRPSLEATCSPTLWLSLAQPRRGQHETPKVAPCPWAAVSRLSGHGSWQQDGRGYRWPPDTKPDTWTLAGEALLVTAAQLAAGSRGSDQGLSGHGPVSLPRPLLSDEFLSQGPLVAPGAWALWALGFRLGTPPRAGSSVGTQLRECSPVPGGAQGRESLRSTEGPSARGHVCGAGTWAETRVGGGLTRPDLRREHPGPLNGLRRG